MDNFKLIYKILKALEYSMDLDEFDISSISHDVLDISENRWNSLMKMLLEEGYVQGGFVVNVLGGSGIKWERPEITLRGLTYLQENSLMKKAANIAKGIVDIIP